MPAETIISADPEKHMNNVYDVMGFELLEGNGAGTDKLDLNICS